MLYSWNMEWHAILGILSGILQISVVVPYVRDILKGSTRPNAVSTGLWTLLGLIAVIAQFNAGASWSILLVAGVTFNAAVVTVLALIGYGYAKYGLLDWICLALGLVAVAAWIATSNPITALILVVIASVISSIPTIIKTVREPHSEHTFSWFLVFIASSLSLVSTTRFDIQNLLYPFADWMENILIVCISFFGQKMGRRS